MMHAAFVLKVTVVMKPTAIETVMEIASARHLKMIVVSVLKVIVIMKLIATRIALEFVSAILKLMSVMYVAEIIQPAQTVTALQTVMPLKMIAVYAQVETVTMKLIAI